MCNQRRSYGQIFGRNQMIRANVIGPVRIIRPVGGRSAAHVDLLRWQLASAELEEIRRKAQPPLLKILQSFGILLHELHERMESVRTLLGLDSRVSGKIFHHAKVLSHVRCETCGGNTLDIFPSFIYKRFDDRTCHETELRNKRCIFNAKLTTLGLYVTPVNNFSYIGICLFEYVQLSSFD